MGLPDSELSGPPGGGGMGLPDDDVGEGPPAEGPPGAGAAGRGGPPAGGRGAPEGGGVGRLGGGAAGRGGRAAGGRSGGRGASVAGGAADAAGATGAAGAAGRGAASSSRRGGRGGCSLPEDVTSRPGGGGGVGRPAVRCGGAAGGIEGRGGFHPSLVDPAPVEPGAGLAARAAAWPSPESRDGALAGASEPEAAPALPEESPWPPDRGSGLPPLAGLGSSGCSGRVRPSRSARRRTRSACASSIPEECVLTPIPNARERSRVSLFVIPSSLASSWTRIFAAKVVSDQPFVFPWARTAHLLVRIAALHPRADRCPGTNNDQDLLSLQRLLGPRSPSRNARENAPRRAASAWQDSSVARQSHAPRPGSVRP